MDPRRGQGFGWAVACAAAAKEPAARHVEGLWASFFPPEAGYAVRRSTLASGVQLEVRRGDFCGEASVTTSEGPQRSRLWLRGHAGSLRLAAVEVRAARVSEGLRLLGSVAGGAALLALCVDLIRHPPGFTVDMMFFLGGLLVAAIMVVGLAIGANVGGWLGDQAARAGHARALGLAERDAALGDDLRRWRALVRNLALYRDALAGSSRGQPFRALHNVSKATCSEEQATGGRRGTSPEVQRLKLTVPTVTGSTS